MSTKTPYLLPVLLSLVMVPSALSCTAPVFFNEYHVPVPMFGIGVTTINASAYPRNSTITYDFTVLNANNQSMLVMVTPSENLKAYVEEKNVTFIASEEKAIPLNVNLNGPKTIGKIEVVGICEDGSESVMGTINVFLDARDKKPIKTEYWIVGIFVALVLILIVVLLLKRRLKGGNE